MVTSSMDGAEFEMVTVLESTETPSLSPSSGVTVQNTGWSRANQSSLRVASVAATSAPSTVQA